MEIQIIFSENTQRYWMLLGKGEFLGAAGKSYTCKINQFSTAN